MPDLGKSLVWSSVRRAKQWEVVDRLVKKERKRLADEDWISSVGAGFRLRETSNRIIKTPSVVYTVFKKYKRVPRDRRILPKTIPVRIKDKERFYIVEVPTDIQSLDRGSEQTRNRIIARPGAGSRRGLKGAATAVVEDESRNLYVLGCHHVIAYSKKTANGSGLLNVTIRKNSRNFGIRFLNAAFPNFGGFGIDAALALVDSTSLSWVRRNILRGRISAIQKTRSLYAVDLPVKVLTPGGILHGYIIKSAHSALLPYGGGAYNVSFQELYKLKINNPGPTMPGDSGSPVLNSGNILIGMHFWGIPDHFISYMIPSYILFRTDTFGRSLDLAD